MTRPEITLLYDYTFANTVLPNALISELGIVTYLHTLHSNRLTHNGFFEDYPGNINPLNLIFDDSYGKEPNSLRHNGSHLNAGFFRGYADIKEDSLFYGKQKLFGKKYFYPIKITAQLNNFLNITNQGGKSFGEFFWKHMSAQALADVRNNKAIILIDYLQENYVDKFHYDNLHSVLQFSGIPKENIIFLINSFNAQELYENWYSVEERKLQVRGVPFVSCNSSFRFNTQEKSCLSEVQFHQSIFYKRPNSFLFKVKRPRTHRLALFYKMITDGVLEKGDWSFLEAQEYNEQRVLQVSNRYGFNPDLQKIRDVYMILPHNLQSEPGKTDREVSAWTDLDMTAHTDSYFYICTETFTGDEYGREYKSLTEKVFKPIANFQPFLFLAFPGALKLLQDLGFKTFHPFIDESYDEEEDGSRRFNKLYQEIQRLSNMNTDEIHNWYWNLKDILVHNHHHLNNFHKNQQHCVSFIEYLHQRTTG
jgi:hypothetical protein